SDGHLMGGPMEYLKTGFQEMNWPRLGKMLAIVFSCLCVGGSFGGGVAFQVNQSLNAVSMSLPFLQDFQWVYALFLIVLVGAVIIGGIKRIAEVSSRVVPLMFLIYMIMSVFVLVTHYDQIPQVFSLIFQKAFSMSAGLGGFFGVLVTGLQRAAFSSEVGLGSSPIAHAVAKVDHPVEEGVVALLEPFIDTIIICLTTALVILVTGVYENPELSHLVSGQKGAALTSQALAQASEFFPFILSVSVFLFAFSTIVSWSYYGERCFSFVFGEKYALIYKLIVLVVIFLGAIATSTVVMDFCDLMILSMALPNLIGLLALSGKVKGSLNEYVTHLKK
ncbi:MAG: amino acid carrier protein, partial [Oligoflexia bacterium]|nr:amino acid carrier protein [Oligoflexia bacterium]